MKVTLKVREGEQRLIVVHRKAEIGDVTQAPDGTWECLHYASDLSWDRVEGVCDAIELVCDTHVEHMAEKKRAKRRSANDLNR